MVCPEAMLVIGDYRQVGVFVSSLLSSNKSFLCWTGRHLFTLRDQEEDRRYPSIAFHSP